MKIFHLTKKLNCVHEFKQPFIANVSTDFNMEELTPWPQSELPTRQGDVAPLSGPSLKLSSWGPRSCDLLIQRWLMAGDGYFAYQRRLLFVARSNKDPRQVFLITPEHGWLDVFCIYMQTAIFMCIFIFIFQLRVLFDIVIYTCILFIWYETRNPKNPTRWFVCVSNQLWWELIGSDQLQLKYGVKGIQLLYCFLLFFFWGGGEKFWTWSLQKDFWVFHVFTFDVVSCLYFWGFFNLLSPSLSN